MVKAERGGKSAREHMTSEELGHMYTLQNVQVQALRKRESQGYKEVLGVVDEVADKFEAFLKDVLS